METVKKKPPQRLKNEKKVMVDKKISEYTLTFFQDGCILYKSLTGGEFSATILKQKYKKVQQ